MIRVVIDLTDGPQGAALKELGTALKDRILAVAPAPMALVVTETQREHVPAACAQHPGVRMVFVRDAAAGWERVARLAASGAAVVSSRRYSPLMHWIAVEWSLREVALSPGDGLERWSRSLAIDDVLAAASLRDVALLLDPIDPITPPSELTSTPVKLRELLAALSYGRDVSVRHERGWTGPATPADAMTRLGWGCALDVPVTATEHEWGTLLFERAKALGAGVVTRGDDVEVTAQCAKVARGASPNRAVIVGGSLHLVNPSPAIRTQMGSLHGVFLHDETTRASGVERIRALAKETPWEQWLDDPYMDDALARIDPQSADRDELEYARASLLLHDRLRPPSAEHRRDWRALLSAMIALEPPPAAIRAPVAMGEKQKTVVFLPAREVDRRASMRGKELVGIRAIAPPRITRDDSIAALEASTERVGGGEWNAWIAQRRFLLPSERKLDDAESVIDLFVRAPSRNILTPDLLRWWNHSPDDHMLGLFWPSTILEAERDFWRDADRHLGMLWIALRRALANGLDATLHDGTGLLEMGGGHIAEVVATSRGPHKRDVLEAEFACAFDPDIQVKRLTESAIVRGIGTRAAQHGKARVDLTTSVPRRLFLSIHDARVQITFHATPWESQRESNRFDVDTLLGAATQEWERTHDRTSPGMPAPISQ